jgi:RNA polymerase sigma-70 factor (ECF subfamily)
MSTPDRTVIEETEKRWVEGLRQNDSASIAAIYDTYGALAYGLALRIVGATAEAEDVVQEAFLALWRQAGRLDPSQGIKSYLLTIVHHKAIDRLRRHVRKPETPLDPAAPYPALDRGPEESAERASEREVIRDALSQLPEEQRLAVEMTYFMGLTTNEAAARLQVPVGTVKSRLRLALTRLRTRLAAPE